MDIFRALLHIHQKLWHISLWGASSNKNCEIWSNFSKTGQNCELEYKLGNNKLSLFGSSIFVRYHLTPYVCFIKFLFQVKKLVCKIQMKNYGCHPPRHPVFWTQSKKTFFCGTSLSDDKSWRSWAVFSPETKCLSKFCWKRLLITLKKV